MQTAIITFKYIEQNSQQMAMDDPNQNSMFSEVYFSLEVGERFYPGLKSIIRQPFGTDHYEPIEVEKPTGYDGKTWNHDDFQLLVERYYFDCMFGGVPPREAVRNTSLFKNTVVRMVRATMEIEDEPAPRKNYKPNSDEASSQP